LEGEFAEDQQELTAPAIEVVGVNVEDDVRLRMLLTATA
jgi:hypothetical protein